MYNAGPDNADGSMLHTENWAQQGATHCFKNSGFSQPPQTALGEKGVSLARWRVVIKVTKPSRIKSTKFWRKKIHCFFGTSLVRHNLWWHLQVEVLMRLCSQFEIIKVNIRVHSEVIPHLRYCQLCLLLSRVYKSRKHNWKSLYIGTAYFPALFLFLFGHLVHEYLVWLFVGCFFRWIVNL